MSTPATQALEHRTTPWLFAAALVTTLPHVEHQPVWLSLLAGIMMLWGGWLWWRNQPLPNRWMLTLSVILASGCVLLEFHTLFGRDAGVALLVLFMSMKLLELKSKRDGMVIITLGYFLLLTHYFYSQNIPTGAWLLASIWLLTASLIRLNGGPGSSFKITLRYAGLITLQALPFMLVLYLLFPRVSGPLWGLPQDAYAGKTGLSNQMSPGSISNLVQSGEIAFRVRFDGDIPPKGKLYWRGPVLEAFDGFNWEPQAGKSSAERIEVLGPLTTYETTMEPQNQRWLLALDAPTQLAPEFALNGRLTATSRDLIVQRQRFRLAASLDYRFNVIESTATLNRNLHLPNGRNPQTISLAKRWRDSSENPPQIIQKALALFSSTDFAYTLQAPLLGQNSIDDFIFQSKRGFCEHYAAAFVVLMRAAGIPARVVTGYQGGELNPLDGFLVVRQSDAHAWTEVWLENRGWIRIDPTAVVSPSRVDSGITSAMATGEPLPALIQIRSEWLRSLRHRWEAANNAWNQYILGYDPKRQRELLSRLGIPDTDWKNLAATLAISCLSVLVAVTVWTLYQRPQRDPASKLWQKALRRLARRKVNCAPWETPLALINRLQTEYPALATPYAHVAAAYLKARYGREPADLNELRKAISQLP